MAYWNDSNLSLSRLSIVQYCNFVWVRLKWMSSPLNSSSMPWRSSAMLQTKQHNSPSNSCFSAETYIPFYRTLNFAPKNQTWAHADEKPKVKKEKQRTFRGSDLFLPFSPDKSGEKSSCMSPADWHTARWCSSITPLLLRLRRCGCARRPRTWNTGWRRSIRRWHRERPSCTRDRTEELRTGLHNRYHIQP